MPIGVVMFPTHAIRYTSGFLGGGRRKEGAGETTGRGRVRGGGGTEEGERLDLEVGGVGAEVPLPHRDEAVVLLVHVQVLYQPYGRGEGAGAFRMG